MIADRSASKHALNDPSVWIARNSSKTLFSVILATVEQRVRDHTMYRALPPLLSTIGEA